MMGRIREPVNFLTHAIPALAAIPAAFLLWSKTDTIYTGSAALIYGLAMFALFATSSIYHGYPSTQRQVRFWQKFDHCCIYIMIAGSYTPTSLLILHGTTKWVLMGLVWAIAAAGCAMKILGKLQNDAISLATYIAMGCLIVPLLSHILTELSPAAVAWMIAGGIFYIGGTYFYYKDMPLSKYVHCHEIWHVFVVMGAASHYIYNSYFLFKIW